MRLYQYDPWVLLDQIRNEVGRLAPGDGETGSNIATSDWAPTVDILEHEDRYVLLADIPGVEPGEIEINMENGCLSIRGERPLQDEDRKAYKRIERPRGTFYRRFSMPDSADAGRISARSRNGVLEVTIPKHEKLQPRRIAIEH